MITIVKRVSHVIKKKKKQTSNKKNKRPYGLSSNERGDVSGSSLREVRCGWRKQSAVNIGLKSFILPLSIFTLR